MDSNPTIRPECERWEGVKSLPRVRELETMGMKRKAVARLFNVTPATIRNAEKKAPEEGKETQ